jgi:hypothetical protein
MNANGQALRWTGRVLAFDDVRRRVNGHGELILSPTTIVTPLAAEQLREQGVRITREPACRFALPPSKTWGIAQERSHPLIDSAVRSLEREGIALRPLPTCEGMECRWAQAIGACVRRAECCGGVIFCGDPGLVCCVANKTTGVRAVSVTTVSQAARATLTLGANVLAVEMPGRTFFEIRQILRTLCLTATTCPPDVATTLQELDGHAHR